MSGRKKNIRAAVLSQPFCQLYHDVMMLIEDVNCYIHGEGRLVMRDMLPDVAHFYTEKAMQLSSRLMQMAGLLLLIRAAAEGDMSMQDMEREREKITSMPQKYEEDDLLWADVPEFFYALNQKSLSLAWQVNHLNHVRAKEGDYHFSQGKNPVETHMERLRTCFERVDTV